jgi:hypothetical protein
MGETMDQGSGMTDVFTVRAPLGLWLASLAAIVLGAGAAVGGNAPLNVWVPLIAIGAVSLGTTAAVRLHVGPGSVKVGDINMQASFRPNEVDRFSSPVRSGGLGWQSAVMILVSGEHVPVRALSTLDLPFQRSRARDGKVAAANDALDRLRVQP